jgi:hypothetical protein
MYVPNWIAPGAFSTAAVCTSFWLNSSWSAQAVSVSAAMAADAQKNLFFFIIVLFKS